MGHRKLRDSSLFSPRFRNDLKLKLVRNNSKLAFQSEVASGIFWDRNSKSRFQGNSSNKQFFNRTTEKLHLLGLFWLLNVFFYFWDFFGNFFINEFFLIRLD